MSSVEYTRISLIKVGLDFANGYQSVGRILTHDKKIYFEYSRDFLSSNLAISPFKIPLKAGVQHFEPGLFGGLPGVFNDSLPDGWGRLLLDRALRARGIQPADFAVLDRLSQVGHSGMGALVYDPDYGQAVEGCQVNLDEVATQAQALLSGNSNAVIADLLALNGSSAGARPKALIGVNISKQKILHGVHALPAEYEYWLVKFPNLQDGNDSGAIEYVYSQMAKMAGIEMMDTYLFPALNSPGYFATQRFDRDRHQRWHMHTACGLLHSDFRVPSLDYEDLIRLTITLTRDISEAKKMFRLAVFNVFAHNRDDHAKNFSYIMDEQGLWKLSPAYDLTYSSGPGGEQSTMVMGEGKNPSKEQLMRLADAASISNKVAQDIIAQCLHALSQWRKLAKNANVHTENIDKIASKFLC